MRAAGCAVHQSPVSETVQCSGSFVAPKLIEITNLAQLEREVFGPVLHVLPFRREALPDVLHQIRETGYGLTLGVHSRIDETIAQVLEAGCTGNLYVKRDMVGAVVGVQSFGGEGLSGTGPKAGGPLYLLRLMASHAQGAARHLVLSSGVALDGPLPQPGTLNASVQTADVTEQRGGPSWAAAQAFVAWLHDQGQGRLSLALLAQKHLDLSFARDWRGLSGPTGETNVYAALPRETVLCLAESEDELLRQTGAVLAVGGRIVWPAGRSSDCCAPGTMDKRCRFSDWCSSAA